MKKIFDTIIKDDGPEATVVAACGRTPWDEGDREDVWRPSEFLKLRQSSLEYGSSVHPWEDIVQAWEATKEDTLNARYNVRQTIFPALGNFCSSSSTGLFGTAITY